MSEEQKNGLQKWIKRGLWLDILLLILIFFGAAGAVFLWKNRTVNDGKETPVLFTVLLSDREWTEGDALQNPLFEMGCRVQNENGTAYLGRVESIATYPHRIPTARDGKVAFADVPGRTDIRVTVSASAKEKEGDGMRVGDIRIAAGMKAVFRFGDFYTGECTVISVKRGQI